MGLVNRICVSWLVLLSCGTSIAHAQVSVRLELETSELLVNDPATFSVVVSNGKLTDTPTIPDIPGCTVQFAGQQSHERRDGRRLVESIMRYQFRLQAQQPGDFVIPPISVTVAGKQYTTEPQKFSVLKSRSSNLAFAEVSCAADKLYVGQKARFTLTVWLKPARYERESMDAATMQQLIKSPQEQQGMLRLTDRKPVRRSPPAACSRTNRSSTRMPRPLW